MIASQADPHIGAFGVRRAEHHKSLLAGVDDLAPAVALALRLQQEETIVPALQLDAQFGQTAPVDSWNDLKIRTNTTYFCPDHARAESIYPVQGTSKRVRGAPPGPATEPSMPPMPRCLAHTSGIRAVPASKERETRTLPVLRSS